MAFGAEFTLDYHERSRLATGRGVFDLAGMLLAAAAIGYLGSAEQPRAAAQYLAIAFGLTALVTFALHVALTRERETFQGRGSVSFVAAGRDVLANPHARILLLVFFLEMLSLSFLGVLFPFLAQDVGAGVNPGVAIGGVMVIALLSVPLWLRLSRRSGKRTPWLIGIGAKGAGFGLLYFLGGGSGALSLLPIALIGAGQACTAILPTSIKADVIDFDELQTGERKEGAYFAAWNLASAIASAIAIGASGLLLQCAEYQPNAAEQAPGTMAAIRVCLSALPVGLHGLALIVLLRFQLGPREHERIRQAIATARALERG
jgi:GPH family glycoside/pentoside/hexuronide:cation symporter